MGHLPHPYIFNQPHLGNDTIIFPNPHPFPYSWPQNPYNSPVPYPHQYPQIPFLPPLFNAYPVPFPTPLEHLPVIVNPPTLVEGPSVDDGDDGSYKHDNTGDEFLAYVHDPIGDEALPYVHDTIGDVPEK